MRVLNRPLAFILAVALIAGCVIVIAEVIGHATGKQPAAGALDHLVSVGTRTRWDAGVVRVWSAVLIVIGLLILAVELKPAPCQAAPAAVR